MIMEQESSPVTTINETSEQSTGWMQSAIETVVQTSFGQTILKLIDKFLWIVEKSAEWSLCQESTEEDGKTFGKLELVRPLPWILFLPGLVVLRTIRVGINIGAFIVGYPQIQPTDMVRFVQKSRRRLKSIKTNGLRNLRHGGYGKKDKILSMNEAKKALIRSIRLTLSTLSCLEGSKPSLSPPPTRIHLSALDLDAATTPEEKSTTESTGSPIQKRKYSTMISSNESLNETEEETLESKIDRLALETNVNDQDFNPDDCSISSNTTSDKDEVDSNISISELRDITEEAKALFANKMPNFANDKIKEEQASQKKTSLSSKKHCENFLATERVASSHSIDSMEFLSLKNPSQDGDGDYYSPMSSKSNTPERAASANDEKTAQTEILNTNELRNGEIYSNSESTISTEQSNEDIHSGVNAEKHNTSLNKPFQKGKRTSHGKSKKK